MSGKKILRKQKKRQGTFEKETNIATLSFPTQNIAICNAGLVNGLSEELLYESFSKFGLLDRILMLPGKSYSFVSFKTTEAAKIAFENCNGKLNLAQDNKPLYLAYVEQLPESTNEICMEKPSGFRLFEDFVSEDEEKLLLNAVNLSEASGSLKHRQVKHFGYEFRYDINNVDKNCPLDCPIPDECNMLWDRLKTYNISTGKFQPDQLTINSYEPGQGIPPHVDTHSAFTDTIAILSFGSEIVMDFRHPDGRHVPMLLPRRSLAIIDDECRYLWTHGITPRKLDITHTHTGLTVCHRRTRISFTFRQIRNGECHCNYVEVCDSYQKNLNRIKNEEAVVLEKNHVLHVYDNIASHFSDTRHKPWPKVYEFVHSFDTGSIVVDIGCGNGKYLTDPSKIVTIGCDTSLSLLELCKQKNLEIFSGNGLHVPLKDNCADGVISIAVIHHLGTMERRLQVVKEMIRIAKLDGRILIYVWAKDQNKDEVKSSYLKQDRKNRKDGADISNRKIENGAVTENLSLPIHKNRHQFQSQDVLVPWKLKESDAGKEQRFLRFYHVFEDGEIENLCKKLPNVKVINGYYDQGNCCIELKKTKV